MRLERTGMSKQAVQQHPDALARDGIAERADVSSDGRRRLVRLPAIGRRLIADADLAKQRIEAAAGAALGADRPERLKEDLKHLAATRA